MDYCSAIWGYETHIKLNRIHLRAIRLFLGVNRSATVADLEGDMGWKPPIIQRKIHMLRYWNGLVKMEDSRLPKIMYNQMKLENNLWFKDRKTLFQSVNALDVLERNVPIINAKQFSIYAEGKLLSDFKANWASVVENKPEVHYYKAINNDYITENYCLVNLKRSQRSSIAKLRLSMLPINVELGRYLRKPREQRLCTLCDQNVVEDELHVLFQCRAHKAARMSFFGFVGKLDPEFNSMCDIDKMELITTNFNFIRKTAIFINEILLNRIH